MTRYYSHRRGDEWSKEHPKNPTAAAHLSQRHHCNQLLWSQLCQSQNIFHFKKSILKNQTLFWGGLRSRHCKEGIFDNKSQKLTFSISDKPENTKPSALKKKIKILFLHTGLRHKLRIKIEWKWGTSDRADKAFSTHVFPLSPDVQPLPCSPWKGQRFPDSSEKWSAYQTLVQHRYLNSVWSRGKKKTQPFSWLWYDNEFLSVIEGCA